MRRVVALVGTAVLVLGCGGAASPSAPASQPPAASATPAGSAPASPDVDLTTPYESKAGTLPTVRIAQSVPSLAFAPLMIADRMNFFGYQGVDVEYIVLESGSTAVQALLGGNIDLTDGATTGFANAVGEGVDLLAIQNTALQQWQVCVSEDYLASAGVDVDDPVEDRVAALRGATIAISGPGAGSDRFMRWLLTKYAGLNPDTDTTITAVSGGNSAIVTALDAGQVDATLATPSLCGLSEVGQVLVQPTEIPEFGNSPLEILFGTREWIEANPEVARGAATAISMGNNFILEHPDPALELLREDIEVAPDVLERDFRDIVLEQTPPDGRMDSAMWDDLNTILVEGGVVDSPLDTTEGRVWTNEYIGDASLLR